MTTHAEVALIAQRVLQAFEDPKFGLLHYELSLAEQFAGLGQVHERDRASGEERSELLGAIAQDMRVALERGATGRALRPHRRLLRHLSRSAPRLN